MTILRLSPRLLLRLLPHSLPLLAALLVSACTAKEAGGNEPSLAQSSVPSKSATGNGATVKAGSEAAPAAAINSLDTIIADMAKRNDFKLRGYEDKTAGWYVGPGHVQMGNVPNLANAPAYWLKYHPERRGHVMKAILPWIVLFDGPAHNATNTRVQFKNFRLFVKSRTSKQWKLLGHSPGVGGFNTPKATLFGGHEAENKRAGTEGSIEIKPPVNPNLAWHGWWNKGRITIDPDDIEAVFATVQARLVVDDTKAGDDRAKAQLGFHVGVDYYYDAKTNWDVVNPGVGVSRVKRVTENWQAFNFMTFSDVGVQEPGGGITEAAFRAAPPPLE